MRYLVKARPIPARKAELLAKVADGSLGTGSVAFGEYEKNMHQARELDDGTVCWLEVCFCSTPLQEERPYWEAYFQGMTIEYARNPRHCRDANGEEPRACFHCDCTQALGDDMATWGRPFLR